MKKWIVMLACAALLALLLPLTMASAAIRPERQVPRTTDQTKPNFTPEQRAEWKERLQDEWSQLKQIREEQMSLRKQIGQKRDALTPLLKAVQAKQDKEKALALVPLQLQLQELRAENRGMRQEMRKLRPGDKQLKQRDVAEVEAALRQKIQRAQTQTENLKKALQIVTQMETVLK